MKKGNYTWSQRRRGQEEELEGNDGGMGSRDGGGHLARGNLPGEGSVWAEGGRSRAVER